MFIARSYVLNSPSTRSEKPPATKKALEKTPRTVPRLNLEGAQAFGWKPAAAGGDGKKQLGNAPPIPPKSTVTRQRSSARRGAQSEGSDRSERLDLSQGSTQLAEGKSTATTRSVEEDGISSFTLPLRSQPVPVPAKHRASRTPAARSSRSSSSSTPRVGSLNQGPQDATAATVHGKHDPSKTSPAVSALLAMTNIPRRSSFPKKDSVRRSSNSLQKMSAQDLMDEWRLEDVTSPESLTGVCNSPGMSVLLAPPDKSMRDGEGEEEALFGSVNTDPKSPGMEFRSVSSESVPSIDTDDEDNSLSLSMLSSPPTSVYRKSAEERRERTSSPKSVDCASDHPLIPRSDPDSTSRDACSSIYSVKSRRLSRSGPLSTNRMPGGSPVVSARKQSSKPNISSFSTANKAAPAAGSNSLKSNLTASLAALRSAARSVSNFAGPSIPPDDYLSRNFFTVPYSSERRPKPIEGIPAPELRRYLNPPHSHVPPSRAAHSGRFGGAMYDFHIHESHIDHTDLEAVAAAAAAAAHSCTGLRSSDGGFLAPPPTSSRSPASPTPAHPASHAPWYHFNSDTKSSRPQSPPLVAAPSESLTAIPLKTYLTKKSPCPQRQACKGRGPSSRKSFLSPLSVCEDIGDDGEGRILNSSETRPALRQQQHQQRTREPRENSDFLRVCVLEMRMRKAGKLDPLAQGRARVWLPPRAAALSSAPQPAFSTGAPAYRRSLSAAEDDERDAQREESGRAGSIRAVKSDNKPRIRSRHAHGHSHGHGHGHGQGHARGQSQSKQPNKRWEGETAKY